MTIEQRKLFRQFPEFKEIFIKVVSLQETIEEIPSLQKAFQGYLVKNRKDFEKLYESPDAEI